jgi:hypothetical protein
MDVKDKISFIASDDFKLISTINIPPQISLNFCILVYHLISLWPPLLVVHAGKHGLLGDPVTSM